MNQEGFSNGFAFGDLDNDGDLDLVVNNLDAKMSLYANQSDLRSHHYLQLQFEGPKQNPLGIGTQVVLSTPSRKQRQSLSLSRGFQSSVAPVLHFGLFEQRQIEYVEIIWPDGKRQLLQDIQADQKLIIKYSEATEAEAKP
ncbi:MAG: ASPIC/UnbV domain-containing protein, partial [Bacteroidota bacterium]